ncbi:tail fiber protein, partial [Parageobacillus toebii]
MASNTPRLGLYKKDPVADANDTFNIQTMLNDNWDKIDSKVATLGPDGKIPAEQLPQQSLPTASTTQAGIVKLNTSTNSTSTTEAATPSAVKDVNDALAAHSAETATNAHLAKNIGIEDRNNHFTATDVEGALEELFTSVRDGKLQVRDAITNKGGIVADGDGDGIPTFQEIANGVNSINVGKYDVGDIIQPSSLEGPVFSQTFETQNVGGWSIDDGNNVYYYAGTTVYKRKEDGTLLWSRDVGAFLANIESIAVTKNGTKLFLGGGKAGNTNYGKIIVLDGSNGNYLNTNFYEPVVLDK